MSLFILHTRHFNLQTKPTKTYKMSGSYHLKVGIFLLVSFIEIQGDNLCTGIRSSGLLADLFNKDPTTGKEVHVSLSFGQ